MKIPQFKIIAVLLGLLATILVEIILLGIYLYIFGSDFITYFMESYKFIGEPSMPKPDLNIYTYATITFTELLLPFFVGGFVTARLAKNSPYFNSIFIAIILYAPFAYYLGVDYYVYSYFYIKELATLFGALLAVLLLKKSNKAIKKDV